MKPPIRWIRPSLVVVLAVWVGFFSLEFLRAQPGRGGGVRPGGAAPYRPPAIPQPRPWTPNPGRPNPQPYNPPSVVYVTQWSCSSCGTVVGTGAQPALASCPHCSARFNNGMGGEGGSVQMLSQTVAEDDADTAVLGGFVLLVLGVMVLLFVVSVGVVVAVVLLTRRKKYTPKYDNPFAAPVP